MEFYDFPYIGNVIIPFDELIFFRVVGQSPTRILWLIVPMTTVIVIVFLGIPRVNPSETDGEPL